MRLSDLPPGVSASDIPGNEPDRFCVCGEFIEDDATSCLTCRAVEEAEHKAEGP